MIRLRKNIVANFVGKGWGVFSFYIFVPVYLHFLGVEAYGLVGFYAMLYGILALSDMGLTATLNREMARLSGTKNSEWQMRHLLITIEMVYLGISILMAFLVLVIAGPIAHHWLNANSLPISSIERAIRLMGIAFALQFLSGLYLGGLLGLQRQVLANAIKVLVGVVRGGGTVLVLWLISPTIEAFFLWQILSSSVLLILFRKCLWSNLPKNPLKVIPRLSFLKGVWRYSTGMMIISLISIILMQVDKITISKMLSLETLGYYTLASALAQAPCLLSGSIGTAIFPHLTQLMAARKEHELDIAYHKANQLLASIVFPIGLPLVAFSRELIAFWAQSPQIADNTHFVASLLVIGSIALAIQNIPFQLVLAAAWTRLPIYLGLCSVIIIVPFLILLIRQYGVVGAGISWLVLNCTAAPVFVFLLHRRILKGHAVRWFFRDMAPPFLLALLGTLLGRLYVTTDMNMGVTVVSIGFIVAICCTVCLALFALGFYRFRLNPGPRL